MEEKRDLTALDWVLGEISESLNQSRQALEAYMGDVQDITQLRFCLTHLHQVYGSFADGRARRSNHVGPGNGAIDPGNAERCGRGRQYGGQYAHASYCAIAFVSAANSTGAGLSFFRGLPSGQ